MVPRWPCERLKMINTQWDWKTRICIFPPLAFIFLLYLTLFQYIFWKKTSKRWITEGQKKDTFVSTKCGGCLFINKKKYKNKICINLCCLLNDFTFIINCTYYTHILVLFPFSHKNHKNHLLKNSLSCSRLKLIITITSKKIYIQLSMKVIFVLCIYYKVCH